MMIPTGQTFQPKMAWRAMGGELFHPGARCQEHSSPPGLEKVLGTPGVYVVDYTTCMFEGIRRRKCAVLITNHLAFKNLGLFCSNRNVCDRTHEKHLRWRPTTSSGKVMRFCTGDEREYPSGFCKAYAKIAHDLLGEHDCLVEVLSGPNAPLSSAVCAEFGMELRDTSCLQLEVSRQNCSG